MVVAICQVLRLHLSLARVSDAQPPPTGRRDVAHVGGAIRTNAAIEMAVMFARVERL